MGDLEHHQPIISTRKNGKGGGKMAKATIISELKESTRYKNIMNSLVEQLSDSNGLISEHYLDMIEHYMALWTTAKALEADIEKRGVTVKWNNGGGQKGVKKNESVAELNKTLQQMSKLLESLGIKPTDVVSGSDGDEL